MTLAIRFDSAKNAAIAVMSQMSSSEKPWPATSAKSASEILLASWLTFMAKSRRSSGLYLAFNKAIATEAKEKFPRTVDCRTTHSLAYRSVVSSYSSSDKLTKTLYAPQFAAIARYPPRRFGQKLRLTGVQQAHLVLGTIKRFCQSADPDIVDAHVPRYGRLLSVSGPTLSEVRAWSVAQATALWQRMKDRNDDLPMGHDGYLKL